MRQFIISIFVLFICQDSLGQGNNVASLMKTNMAKADQFYNYLDYRTAQFYYYKVLDKEPENKKARLRIAECYLKLDDASSAQEWLRDLANDPDASADTKLKYAEVLRMNGDYTLAQSSYQSLLDEEGYNEGAYLKLRFLERLPYYTRNHQLYDIDALGINSEQSDFSPQLWGQNLVFVSSRRQEILIQYQPATAHNDLEVMLKYFLAPVHSLNNPESVLPLNYGEQLKSKFHDGPLWFYDQGRKVAFTRNNPKNVSIKNGARLVNLEMYFAECNNDGTWENVGEFPFNNEAYSVGHPTLNANGSAIYFASNMPGGFGGSDIYVSHLQGGEWGAPLNLGPAVNTGGEEFYPYLKTDSTLFFASSGHGGFGGLDIFVTYWANGVFGSPANLGAPLNSSADDLSILIDASGRKGYIASNRPGGAGLDDIYAFSSNYYFVAGDVIELLDNNQPVGGAEITFLEQEGQLATIIESDENGLFHIDLPYDKNYLVSAKKDGYTFLEDVSYSTWDKTIGYDSLSLSLWKNDLMIEGRIFSNETQTVLASVIVTIENLETGRKDSVVSQSDGTYLANVLPNKRYRIEADHRDYLPNGYNLNTKNLYQGKLVNDILLEEEFMDKTTIYFEYDAWRFNSGSNPELAEILKTLERFPNSIVNITAHADARGTKEYNQTLSDKRVSAVLNYFTSKGIKKSRIQGKGFGEELHLNDCSDGVDCMEEDHSQNRRAEIKVQVQAIHQN